MFSCSAFACVFNQDISAWDVSRVNNMDAMFRSSPSFQQDLSSWCVEKISYEPNSFALNVVQPNWGEACPTPCACSNDGAASGFVEHGDCACDCTGTTFEGATCEMCTAETPVDLCYAFTDDNIKTAVDAWIGGDTDTYGDIKTW
jgi:hypothetical protein